MIFTRNRRYCAAPVSHLVYAKCVCGLTLLGFPLWASTLVSVDGMANLHYYTGDLSFGGSPSGGEPADAVPLAFQPGQSVTLLASGCTVSEFSTCVGPDGDASAGMVLGIVAYSLIGRWSTSSSILDNSTSVGSVFFIGANADLAAPSAGVQPFYLYLGVNDNYFWDSRYRLHLSRPNPQCCLLWPSRLSV